MINFEYQNPTKIIFGKGSLEKFPKEVMNYGNHVLLVYGRSVKQNGIYNQIVEYFNQNNIKYYDLSSVTYPSLDCVYKGIEIAKKNHVNIVLGIGGGTCIDVAKSIALGAANDVDIWDVLSRKVSWDNLNCLPIGAIVTVAGSGSEMDGNSEIENTETGVHGSIGSFQKTYPTFAILDPELTYSCPWKLTAYHTMTIVVQAMEQYLIDTGDTPIQDGFVEVVCKTVMDSLRVLKNDLNNYSARANIMWASALTCNRILGRGKGADWLGGAIGGLIDDPLNLTYAQGIAITWPKYLLTCYKDHLQTMKSFALHVMNIDPTSKTDEEIAHEGAQALQDFYKEMGIATTAKELGVNKYDMNEIEQRINHLAKRNVISKEDIKTIVRLAIGG